jgi:hypothetical protein
MTDLRALINAGLIKPYLDRRSPKPATPWEGGVERNLPGSEFPVAASVLLSLVGVSSHAVEAC